MTKRPLSIQAVLEARKRVASSYMSRKATIDGWFRRLEGDRLEIFFKTANVMGEPDRKIRASGPASDMNELAQWFEDKSGMRINAPWRTVNRDPIPGQTAFDFPELTMGEVTEEVEEDNG
jgi:hypothetical protein